MRAKVDLCVLFLYGTIKITIKTLVQGLVRVFLSNKIQQQPPGKSVEPNACFHLD